MQARAIVRRGVGRAGNHVHFVAQFTQGAAQMAHVHPLAPAMRIAPIAEKADAQGALAISDAYLGDNWSIQRIFALANFRADRITYSDQMEYRRPNCIRYPVADRGVKSFVGKQDGAERGDCG